MPYESVEPTMDAQRVEALLGILDLSRDMPDLKPIFNQAYKELAKIAHDLVKAEEEEKEDA